MADWYPILLPDRAPWHANFAAQAAANGVSLGLSAGQVTQIGVDAANVAVMSNFLVAVDTFRQASTAWKNIIFDAALNAPLPAAPTAPTVPTLAGSSLASIQARTRQYAGIIKASPAYTTEQGERYGIIAPARGANTTPALVPAALTQSQISLSVAKGGYSVVAIDSRRGGGGWEQIGISMTATYIDARVPLVAGQPELREYRAQGMASNARVGALSGIVSAVTMP